MAALGVVPASRVAIDSSSLLIAFGPLLTFKAPAPKLIISDEFNLMVLKHCKLIATTSFSQARILKGHPLGWKGLLHNYCVSTANHCRFFLPNPCHFQGLSVCIGKYLFMQSYSTASSSLTVLVRSWCRGGSHLRDCYEHLPILGPTEQTFKI